MKFYFADSSTECFYSKKYIVNKPYKIDVFLKVASNVIIVNA